MALLLNVPYQEKDSAKALGAKWNPELKKWYVQNYQDYPKFIQWIDDVGEHSIIICDHLYLIIGKRYCWNCKKETRVIAFGVDNYYSIFRNDDWNEIDISYEEDDDIRIASSIEPMPSNLLSYIQKEFNYKNTYSNMKNTAYLANCCDYCDSLQGEFYLYQEVNSPFFIDSIEKAEELTLHKIPLKYDILTLDTLAYSTTDEFIGSYSHIILKSEII